MGIRMLKCRWSYNPFMPLSENRLLDTIGYRDSFEMFRMLLSVRMTKSGYPEWMTSIHYHSYWKWPIPRWLSSLKMMKNVPYLCWITRGWLTGLPLLSKFWRLIQVDHDESPFFFLVNPCCSKIFIVNCLGCPPNLRSKGPWALVGEKNPSKCRDLRQKSSVWQVVCTNLPT